MCIASVGSRLTGLSDACLLNHRLTLHARNDYFGGLSTRGWSKPRRSRISVNLFLFRKRIRINELCVPYRYAVFLPQWR